MSAGFACGHALVVGVGADLPGTVDDAVGLAGILRDPARCAYPPDQVHTLTGERATRDAFLSALDALARSTDPQSTVVVYFSGHGCRVASPVGEFCYLVTHGYDLDRLYQTAVSGAEFADWPGASTGCGVPGRTVAFEVDSQAMLPPIIWDNNHVRELSLGTGSHIYLPVIFKDA